MLRPVLMGYTMGYSMGSILRAILGRPYDSAVLTTPAATLQVCGLFKSAYFEAKARSRGWAASVARLPPGIAVVGMADRPVVPGRARRPLCVGAPAAEP